jgi:hypothetical protein
MPLFDDLLAAHRDEQTKIRNLPIDRKTHELVPQLRQLFTGRMIYGGTVELFADTHCFPTFDAAIVKVVKANAYDTPDWLYPGHSGIHPYGPNVLIAAWYLPNGMIHFQAKNPDGTPDSVREFDSPEALFQGMDSHLQAVAP